LIDNLHLTCLPSSVGLWKKEVLYEFGVRVPLYIRDPREPSSHGSMAVNTMAELVDIYPTLAELAGLPPPASLSGVSLAAAVRDAATRRCVAGLQVSAGLI